MKTVLPAAVILVIAANCCAHGEAATRQAVPDVAVVLQQAAEAAYRIPSPQSRAIALAEVAKLYLNLNTPRAAKLFADARYACSLEDDPMVAILAQRGVLERWASLERAKALDGFRLLLEMTKALKYRAQRALVFREIGPRIAVICGRVIARPGCGGVQA